ncbi:MarR family transcriptional regulator [Martelella mediterranea]|uniref:MarR family winged helix-turn-helix transcriptional regulator n=1 Tax=Martelella mediterranea TaxID=293089 RepID=UPI001E437F9F|nr:MarR family transcriptional regulator [Martelella mediterranea]MCD1634269.1 MarR family transcriptional regulator [Martelella mediterranea]
MRESLPLSVTVEVRDRCICLHLQRAARTVGRYFDEVLRPLGLTNGQYSLLVSLNRPEPPRVAEVAHVLAMDRTTLTASIKPLERRGLMTSFQDDKDRRVRRLKLTDEGRNLLEKAVPIWRETHDRIDKVVGADIDRLRDNLLAMTFALPDPDDEISDPEP